MNYYNEIKEELINNELNKKVKTYSINKRDLITYYNVVKTLSEAGKHYGENVIKQYANKLKKELNKKYNERTLRRYRQFYNFATNLKWSAMPTKLSWSHITELMVLSNKDEIEYYMSVVNDRNIGYRKLNHNKTIGLIICKKENRFVIEYSSDKRIITRKYELI